MVLKQLENNVINSIVAKIGRKKTNIRVVLLGTIFISTCTVDHLAGNDVVTSVEAAASRVSAAGNKELFPTFVLMCLMMIYCLNSDKIN